jgi:hypothetical protein
LSFNNAKLFGQKGVIGKPMKIAESRYSSFVRLEAFGNEKLAVQEEKKFSESESKNMSL